MKPAANELPIGRLAGAFGVHGELKCDPTSTGRTLFSAGVELRCQSGDRSLPVRVTHVRGHKNRLLIRIEGVNDADTAAAYAGATLFAPRERVELAAGEYLDDDLVGCSVCGGEGTEYGTVERVEHYPASDMLVVGGRMVPMVEAIVKNIDLAQRRITIDPPAGLME